MSGFFGIMPTNWTSGQYLSMAVRSLSECCLPETLFSITPAMFTSGSKVLKPLTMAAALRVSERASTITMTGSPSSLARYAVEPTSSSPLRPSYSPRTPSMTQMSASLEA